MTGRTVWYPGHMAKGKRLLEDVAKKLDLIIEVRDARAPEVTSSPMGMALSKGCPVWTVLTKKDLADPAITAKWLGHYGSGKNKVWALDLLKGKIDPLRRELQKSAPSHRELRIAVVGIPNVGKSALLNALVGKKAAVVGGIPGVTKGVSWYKGKNFLVVDSPGILDPRSGEYVQKVLAWLGCSKADVIGGYDSVAIKLIEFLVEHDMWSLVEKKWGVKHSDDSFETFELIGKRLGCLVSGGAIDMTLTGRRFLESFSSGKLGVISLESPGSVIEG